MKKTPDNIDLILASADKRRYRIAYAINDEQPVKCSIISDQPLFYMDYESEADDASLDVLFESIGENLAAAAPVENTGKNEALIFAEFMADGLYMTETMSESAQSEDYSFEQAALLRILRQSRLAASYLETAAKYDSRIIFTEQVDTALYDRACGQILINPNISQAEQILLAARELRRLWQHRSGALLNPLTFHPDQAILVNRAQIADLTASMIRIAWELQLAGEKEPWNRLDRSSMADLARAFARESYLDFRTLNNGVACSAVFEAWFLSDRCKNEDRQLIQKMLADYQGYVFDSAQSSKAIGTDLIMALGSMPFGKNYLAPYVATIVGDALFTEVRDRSNANFLWFIKFERSFRETEQELQTAEDIHSRGPNHGDIHNPDQRFDHEKTASVITLLVGSTGSAMEQDASLQSGGADIIEFRHAGK